MGKSTEVATLYCGQSEILIMFLSTSKFKVRPFGAGQASFSCDFGARKTKSSCEACERNRDCGGGEHLRQAVGDKAKHGRGLRRALLGGGYQEQSIRERIEVF